MSQTLDAPVYEVKQDSKWLIEAKARDERMAEFFKKLNPEYFKDNGFAFYHSEHFGVEAESNDFEKYKDELLKNPDKNGVHIFRKKSKYVPIFKKMLEEAEIEKPDPFKAHDVFGFNNVKGSHTVGGRKFFGVKHEKYVIDPLDEVKPIDYKEYLAVVMSAL